MLWQFVVVKGNTEVLSRTGNNVQHLFKKKHNYIMAQCENTEAECIFVWVVSQKVKGHAIKCAVLNFRCSSYHRIQNLTPPNL